MTWSGLWLHTDKQWGSVISCCGLGFKPLSRRSFSLVRFVFHSLLVILNACTDDVASAYGKTMDWRENDCVPMKTKATIWTATQGI
jgi:hypothetical protein